MSKSNIWCRCLAVSAVMMLVTAGAVWGQAQAGSLFGTATDNDGSPLPGVTVTVTGAGAPQVQVTNAQGEFRFLGLSPGTYSLTAALDGFSTVEYPNIVISVNRNTTIEVQLSPAIEETITVTSESPLLDSRKITTGTTVNQVELEKIPSARDPWAVLQTVPGVQTDRINVGGNESGQQSQFTGPGSVRQDGVWAVDGVVITDMGAVGASPSYYNFDAFEELQVSTGGSDVTMATAGVTMNMVTRRGTNDWRGSARYIKADDSWQSDLDFDQSDLGAGQTSFKQGNRIVTVEDYGAEFGGPIIKDKLWIWANYGRNEIDLLTVQDVSDFTMLEDYGGKLNAQLTTANSLVFFYNYGDKIKNGRNAGPTRPQLTTWNQTGPTDIWKLEDTHVFSSSFFLTGMASYVGGGFQLTPQGGLDGPAIRWDENFIWQDNFFHHDTVRPQDQIKLDGNYFFNTGDVSHDLKFGVNYRKVGLESQSLFPGNGSRWDFYGPNPGDNLFVVSRQTINDAETTYEALYVQDTLTVGNLTANFGLRYDRQDGEVFDATAQGVPGFETLPDGTPLMPTATAPGFDQPFTWEDITPRLGVTYALGNDRKTLLRASFSRFARQLGQGNTIFNAPLAPGNSSYAYFNYHDANNDGLVTVDEIVDFAAGPVRTNGYDPLGQFNPNRIDPDLDAPITDELIFGVEHALLPEFVIGATFTLRNRSDLTENERLVIDETGTLRPHTRADYVLEQTATATRPDGSTFPIDIWVFRSGLEDTGGFLLTNGDREQDYDGLSFFFNKRLSNRWMLRGNFTFQNWEWDIPDSEREDPNIYLGGGSVDGGAVLQGSGTGSGSKGAVYINAGWSYSLTGMYQIAPDKNWGFNVSAALTGREGYPIPYFQRFGGRFVAGSINLQATEQADQFSNDDVHVVDLRVEKEFGFNNYNFTLGLELFNALNESTVLQRQHRLAIGTTGFVNEILSPRVWRVGVRFRFN